MTQGGEGRRLAGHYSVLVYPFVHAVGDGSRWPRLHHLQEVWQPWWRRLRTDAALATALDDTYFFLPRIRELLFPEATTGAATSIGDRAGAAGRLGRLGRLSVDDLPGLVPDHAVLRLTLGDERLQELRRLRLDYEPEGDPGFHANVDVDWIDVVLFPQRVGLLAIKLRLDEDRLFAARLSDFHWYARLVHPPAVGWTLARWSGRDPDIQAQPAPPARPATEAGGRPGSVTRSPASERRARRVSAAFESRDLVDYLLQGLVAVAPSTHLCPGMDAFLGCLARGDIPRRYSDTDDGQIYGQTFHVYGYACLADSTTTVTPSAPAAVPLAPTGASSATPAPAPEPASARPFESPTERLLYELATCTDTSDPAYVPHPRVLDAMRERSLIALWENWQGLALRDNVVFLALRESRFTLRVLPHNVESDYFHLYLLALFQWTRLSILSGELVREKQHLGRDLSAVRQLLDEFMMLQNRFWFREVTRKPQGIEIYRRFQQGLDVVPLFDEVQERLGDLSSYYDRRAERRVTNLLTFLTLVLMPLSLTVDLYSNALFDVRKFDYGSLVNAETFPVVPLTFVALACAIFVLWVGSQVVWPYITDWWRAIWQRLKSW